jgi:hypothetical protein
MLIQASWVIVDYKSTDYKCHLVIIFELPNNIKMEKEIKKTNLLYAIYKNGIHLGNVRETSALKAINNYIMESGYPKDKLDDKKFIRKYKAITAEPDTHY